MFSAELESPEFAYMLALVNAQAIVGVDDPELFPLDDPSRDSVYSAGRESLETHGWIKPVKESPDEYDLNPLLFEATARIAAPEIIVAAMRDVNGEEGRLVRHYLAGGVIVELSATVNQKYHIEILSDKNVLFERMVQMLNLATPARSAQFTIDEQAFISIHGMCQKGELDQAKVLMRSIDANEALGESFVRSLGSSVSGQVVVIHPDSVEIKAGRRALVFGDGDGAWMLIRTAADSKEFTAMTCDPDGLGVLVMEWQEELLAANG